MADMKSVYVVEKLVEHQAEAPGATIKDWVSVGTYDDAQEAVRHAQDPSIKEDTRVRVFKVEFTPPTTVAGVQTKHEMMVDPEDLVPFKCLDHPGRTAKGYEGGGEPRCPDCQRNMVPATFGAVVQDWTKGTQR